MRKAKDKGASQTSLQYLSMSQVLDPWPAAMTLAYQQGVLRLTIIEFSRSLLHHYPCTGDLHETVYRKLLNELHDQAT